MLRTKASTYAILAVAEIAKRQQESNAGVQAGEIARSLQLPAAYAAKVLTQLARADVLHSDRGPRGGFRLTRSPNTIDLLEVIEAVDGVIAADVDVARVPGDATTAQRAVDRVFEDVVDQVRSLLRNKSVADLLEMESGAPSPAPNPASAPSHL
jgi:Rrf2 family protein